MAERDAIKTGAANARKRLLADFPDATADSTLAERMALLGISPAERSESVSIAVSVLFERIDDLTRELDEARRQFNELEQLVDVDCLAPVPNRRAFLRRADWALSMLKRYGHACSVLFLDLNGFKRINDDYSHAAGDEVLRQVALLLTRSLRASDFMARLGGDEFVVLLYHAHEDAAQKRAEIIARRISAHQTLWQGHSLHVTASYGTYQMKPDDTAEDAIAQADQAMYRHKKALQ